MLICLAAVSLLLVFKDRRLGEYSFWISLLLYSFLVLASITLGRAGFGAEQALVSRYTSFSILAVVGVYAMLTGLTLERRSKVGIVSFVVLSGFVLVSAAVSYSEGLQVGRNERVSRERSAFVLSTYGSQPDALLAEHLYPNPKRVRKYAPVLERLGYNVFSEPSQANGSPPRLSELSPVASLKSTDAGAMTNVIGLTTQGGSLVVPKEAPFIMVFGWAVDARSKDAASEVYVDVDGKLFLAFYGARRKGIAERFDAPAYEYSGFERAIPVSEIGPGKHNLTFVVLTSDREGYYRPDQRVVFETR